MFTLARFGKGKVIKTAQEWARFRETDMAKTSAERKALETERKAELGLKRRAFWLDDESVQIIETYKLNHQLNSNDEALARLLKQGKE